MARGKRSRRAVFTSGRPAKKQRTGPNAKPRRGRSYAMKNLRTGGFLGIELKFADFEFDAALSATLAGSEVDPATALCLTAVAQGDGENQRDGRKMVVKSVMVRGIVQITAIAAATLQNGMWVKICMVLDKQTNGAQLNAENVFVDPTDTDLDAFTFRDLQFSNRFKVLKSMYLEVNPSAAAGDGAANDQGHYVIPFEIIASGLNLGVNHSATTAAIASVVDNSVHLIAVASPGSAGGVATIKYSSRCRFVG